MIFSNNLPSIHEGQPFHTDFREWIRFELLLTDKDLDQAVKIPTALKLIFPIVPQDYKTAVDYMLWFYRGGKDTADTGKSKGKAKDIYSYKHDDEYIYSAFMECFGIDLLNVRYMHWWQFRALFRSLHDCKFTDIMGYRAADLKDMSDTMRKFYSDMQKAYKLPYSLYEMELYEKKEKFDRMRG